MNQQRFYVTNYNRSKMNSPLISSLPNLVRSHLSLRPSVSKIRILTDWGFCFNKKSQLLTSHEIVFHMKNYSVFLARILRGLSSQYNSGDHYFVKTGIWYTNTIEETYYPVFE